MANQIIAGPGRRGIRRWARHNASTAERADAQAIADTNSPRGTPLLLCSLIDSYLTRSATISGSKRRHLQFLRNHPIAQEDARALTPAKLVEHIQSRHSDGLKPATALNELIWIGIVLQSAAAIHGDLIRPEVARDARAICREKRLVGIGGRRHRTPTDREITSLSEHFSLRDGRADIPMADLVWIAVRVRLRAADICRMEWERGSSIVRIPTAHGAPNRDGDLSVRSLPLSAEVVSILEKHQTAPRIFPYKPRSICVAFARSCESLTIEDLRFDDLRRYRVPALDSNAERDFERDE